MMSVHISGACQRPAARQLLSASRSFSTTAAVLNNIVPPESPSYIRLQKPPQSQEIKRQRVRGHLPVPRDIFPAYQSREKVKGPYFDKTARRPKSREPKNETQEWKMMMADCRRDNLKEGLKELWKRKNNTEYYHNKQTTAAFKKNREAIQAPEREDDRLTRSTVLDAMLDTKVYADPDRFKRAEESKARVQKIEEDKRTARQDALMELYINASSFIVTENELKAEIDTIFAEDYFKKQGQTVGRYGHADNTWDVYGKPPSINNMLESTTGTSTKIMDIYESEYDRSVKRQKRIAEEFTGGKME